MKTLLLALLVLFVTGCASTPKYYCEAGEDSYYADHVSAFVMTEEKLVFGECKET